MVLGARSKHLSSPRSAGIGPRLRRRRRVLGLVLLAAHDYISKHHTLDKDQKRRLRCQGFGWAKSQSMNRRVASGSEKSGSWPHPCIVHNSAAPVAQA